MVRECDGDVSGAGAGLSTRAKAPANDYYDGMGQEASDEREGLAQVTRSILQAFTLPRSCNRREIDDGLWPQRLETMDTTEDASLPFCWATTGDYGSGYWVRYFEVLCSTDARCGPALLYVRPFVHLPISTPANDE